MRLEKKSIPKYPTEVPKLNHNYITNCDHGKKKIYHTEYFSDLSLQGLERPGRQMKSAALYMQPVLQRCLSSSHWPIHTSDSHFHVFKQGK